MTRKTALTAQELIRRNFSLDVSDVVENILASWDRADNATRVAGTAWYADALEIAAGIADAGNIELENAAAVVAHLSPMLSWAENIENARSLVLEDRTHGVLGASVQRARVAMLAVDPASTFSSPEDRSGHKIRSFFENILGDSMAVTIDRHACRVAVGEYTEDTQRALSRKGVYGALAHCYRLAADARGVAPSTMQAVTWCEIRGAAD